MSNCRRDSSGFLDDKTARKLYKELKEASPEERGRQWAAYHIRKALKHLRGIESAEPMASSLRKWLLKFESREP
jgi:hypothetical protein